MSRAAWASSPGIEHYADGDYEAAVQAFQQVLADPQRPAEERGEARIYLAASLHALGRVEEAREHLDALAREHPTLRVDPVRFLPELVALAEVIRQQVQAERDFAAREAELQRQAREEALKRPPPPTPIHVRPETLALFEAVDRRWTVGAGAAFQRKSLEASVRVLLGDPPAFHVQGGLLLGSSALRPFLGVRASLVPGLDSYGAGPVVGARYALPAGFVALAEVGADYFFAARDERYPLAITAQVGLGFNLRLQ
jgi:tetratricopeptide (TPR) repeat protein